MALYQTQPDRKLRAKALAKEYGIGGHSHDFLDGSRGFVNHDWKGLEFVHYPDYQKITLKWAQVEKYIDLMIQSDRYLTDKEKEHYSPPAPVSAKPDGALTHAKNLIRDFCLEEYDSEPDFSDLSKIGIAYTHATDEDIPIQVNVDLVGYRVERYLGEVLIDERQYESLEELTETELEALDFSELVSVTDEELEHYHSKAEERPALLPLDAATEYNALKEQYPDALVGFEQNGQFEFYGEDARKVCELVGGKLLEKETELGTVPVTGFSRGQWAYRAKQLWQCGENVYLAGLNEDGTHHQTKYLRREDYLPLGATIHMEGHAFRVDNVNFDKDSVTLQDVALAEMRMPIFREEPLALVRELYEQEQDDRQLSDEELDALPISAVVDGEVQTFPDAAALDEALNAVPAGNFHITDDHLGEGGAKQKYPQFALQAVMNMIPVNRKFLRGDIYYANLEPHLGSEQGGIRPVVVVQNNTANCYSPNLIVAPVTSNTAKKPDHQAHVLVDGNRAFLQPSMILAESVQTISKGRLIRPMGRLSIPELIRLNYALLYQLDLNEWVWRKEAYERYLRYHR